MLGLFSLAGLSKHRGLGWSSMRLVGTGRRAAFVFLAAVLLSAALSSTVSAQDTKALPIKPVIVEGPAAEGLTQTSALISWKTPFNANGTVNYGLAEDALDQTAATETARGVQSVSLTGLEPGTEYFVRVDTSVPNTQRRAQSRIIRFTTPTVADTQAPVFVAAPAVTGTSNTSLLLSWSTDEVATAEIVVSDDLGVVKVVEGDPAYAQSLVVSGLTASKDYELVVNAVDTSGNRSSATLQATTTATADSVDPVIVDGIVVEHITDTRVHVRWQTSKPSTSVLKFGTTEALDSTQSLPGFRLEHHMVLSGLTAGTLYGIQIDSDDWLGNGPAGTNTFVIETLADPLVATPTINVAPRVVGTTDTTATIYWETSEPSDSAVDFGIDTDRSGHAANSALVLRHQVTLTGLAPGQTYGFVCRSTDLDGQTGEADGGETTATTTAAADTTAPVFVDGPTVVAEADEGVTIKWTTDEPADAVVEYGSAGEALDLVYVDNRLTTEHLVTIRGLEPESSFEFSVRSTDLAGNSADAPAVLTAETGADVDETGPEIVTDPVESEITRTSAILSWETDELSSADIAIGLAPGEYETIQATTGLATSHSLQLTNLAPGTNYSYVLRITDQNQNTTLSESGEFTTDGVVLTGVPRHIFVPVGQKRAIQARSAHPGDTSYTYTSDDPAIASVNDRGVITAVAVGRTSVFVTGIASLSTSEIVVDVYTPQPARPRDLSGFFALLGIFLVQDGTSGIGGPCFIATAASGTPLSGEVALLRDFRDEWLLTNTAGTMLVDAYYNLSPPIADAVAASPVLALVVRLLLLPVLLVVALWMKSPLLVVLPALFLGRRMLRRARRGQAAAQ